MIHIIVHGHFGSDSKMGLKAASSVLFVPKDTRQSFQNTGLMTPGPATPLQAIRGVPVGLWGSPTQGLHLALLSPTRPFQFLELVELVPTPGPSSALLPHRPHLANPSSSLVSAHTFLSHRSYDRRATHHYLRIAFVSHST